MTVWVLKNNFEHVKLTVKIVYIKFIVGRYEVLQCKPKNVGYDEADPNVEDLWLFDLCLPVSIFFYQLFR